MEMEGDTFVDSNGVNFAQTDGSNGPQENRRHSLAQLKELVSSKRDWWEKKAVQTNGPKQHMRAMPHMAATRASATSAIPLLFSLSPQAELQQSDSPKASMKDQSRQKTPQKSPVSKSLPIFNEAFGSPAILKDPTSQDDVTASLPDQQGAPTQQPVANAAQRASEWLEPSTEAVDCLDSTKNDVQEDAGDCFSAEEDFNAEEEEEEHFHDSSDAAVPQEENEEEEEAVAPLSSLAIQALPKDNVMEEEGLLAMSPAPAPTLEVKPESPPSIPMGDEEMTSPAPKMMEGSSPMMLDYDCPPTQVQPSALQRPPPSFAIATDENEDMMEVAMEEEEEFAHPVFDPVSPSADAMDAEMTLVMMMEEPINMQGLFEPLDLFTEGQDEEDGGFEALLFKHHHQQQQQQEEDLSLNVTDDATALLLPPLEATPSPNASPKTLVKVRGSSPLQAPSSSETKATRVHEVRDSIPLFTARQSFVVKVGDSVALDRLSLDDIAPFPRKKLSAGSPLAPLAEEAEANSGPTLPQDKTPLASSGKEAKVVSGTIQGRRVSGGSNSSTPAALGSQSTNKAGSSPSSLTALASGGGGKKVQSAPAPPAPGFLSRLTAPGSNLKPAGPTTTSRLPKAPSLLTTFKPPAPPPPPPAPPAVVEQGQEPEAMEMTPPPPSPPSAPSAATGPPKTAPRNEASPLGGPGWGSLSINMSSDDTSSITDEARRLFGSLLASVAPADKGAAAHQTPGGEGFSFNTPYLSAGEGGAAATSMVPFGGFGGSRSSSQGRLSSTPLPSSSQNNAMPLPSPGAHQMMEMQVNMMIQRLADAESLQQHLEKENEGLRDQLSTLQFIHEGLGGSDKGAEEMERSARQCAEEQLALVTRKLQVAEDDLLRKRKETEELRSLVQKNSRAHEEANVAHAREIEELKVRLGEECQKSQTAAIQVEALTSQLRQCSVEIEGLRSAVASEQAKVGDLRGTLAAKEEACTLAQRSSSEAGAKLQKALEGLTNAQVAQRRQAVEIQGLEAKASSAALALSQVQGERDALAQEVALLKAREGRDVGQEEVARMKAQLAAAAAENKELLGICNQLLAQVEKARGPA